MNLLEAWQKSNSNDMYKFLAIHESKFLKNRHAIHLEFNSIRFWSKEGGIFMLKLKFSNDSEYPCKLKERRDPLNFSREAHKELYLEDIVTRIGAGRTVVRNFLYPRCDYYSASIVVLRAILDERTREKIGSLKIAEGAVVDDSVQIQEHFKQFIVFSMSKETSLTRRTHILAMESVSCFSSALLRKVISLRTPSKSPASFDARLFRAGKEEAYHYWIGKTNKISFIR
ncbi:hypothetical protein IEQ34_005538 [Dendrobium chrysotoxum]|uniref:Uncharacterized protein n=1 Tax=Dendrobium chrysotoxum TaxID=161865 RepID=A0AAV7GU71_DENCH|nr:hypothetical protein IEQ34_005538 [Dendrobium chrysotoxum]